MGCDELVHSDLLKGKTNGYRLVRDRVALHSVLHFPAKPEQLSRKTNRFAFIDQTSNASSHRGQGFNASSDCQGSQGASVWVVC